MKYLVDSSETAIPGFLFQHPLPVPHCASSPNTKQPLSDKSLYCFLFHLKKSQYIKSICKLLNSRLLLM